MYKSNQKPVLEWIPLCYQLFHPKNEEFNVKTYKQCSRLTLAYRTLRGSISIEAGDQNALIRC